jgi:hypothetical protein
MPQSTARPSTAHAGRYLQQLCKHWSHRFAVGFDPRKGSIDFGSGRTVELTASDTGLTITLSDGGLGGLDELERVVADHVKRFAFREELDFAWIRSGV